MSGKFTFYLLLIQLIEQNQIIHYISSIDQRYNFEYLLRKYGINLKKLIDSGLIYFYSNDQDNEVNNTDNENAENYFVEGYDETVDSCGKFISVTFPQPSDNTADSTKSSSRQFQTLFSNLNESLTPPIVFLDDLCGLELDLNDHGISFISILHNYLSAGKIHSLIAFGDDYMLDLSQGDPVVPQDGEGVIGLPLVEYCKNRADILTITSPLSSGYSSDVHGQILITHPSHSSSTSTTRLLYRATDTAGVKCCLSK